MRPDDPLQVIASAVTPVVMVSATAILISGVNSRYMAIADRIRSMTAELRAIGTSEQRRTSIKRQMIGFKRRVRLVSWSIRGLYAASGCFVTMALLISATLWRGMVAVATLPLFLLGILMVIFALVCELIELQVSNQTLAIEIDEEN
jgi:hypothetical protein